MNHSVLPRVAFEPGLSYKVVRPIYSLGIGALVRCVDRGDSTAKFEVVVSTHFEAGNRFAISLEVARQSLQDFSETDQAKFAEAKLASLTDDIAKGHVTKSYLRFLNDSIRLGFAAETNQAIRSETALATGIAVREDSEIFGGVYE